MIFQISENPKNSVFLRKTTNKINNLAGTHWTDLERVMDEYHNLLENNVTPDVFVYSSLFKACAERVPPAVCTAIGFYIFLFLFEKILHLAF